jgi:purine-binding chemotaxis protein CheW
MAKWNGDRLLEIVTLGLEGEIFALEATYVREIIDIVPITLVPNSRPFVNGLINVRGKVVPLADLRLKFGMEQKPPSIDTRIVVIEIELDGNPAIVGILADKVYEVTEIAAASLEETPGIGMRWRPEFILCIGKRGTDFIVVLDIERVFSDAPQKDLPAIGESKMQRSAA